MSETAISTSVDIFFPMLFRIPNPEWSIN